MDQTIDVLLGRRLRGRRRLLGLTQNELALMVGVRFQQIQKYESGANRMSASRLWRLCQALEATPGYFFEGLPSARAETTAPPDAGSDLLESPESLDLIRVFHQLDEDPRRRLLDLARALGEPVDFA
jgi:transcriptional regulator with XRE-family HTH domain